MLPTFTLPSLLRQRVDESLCHQYSPQGLDIEGTSNLASAVQIAQLALKHRQNKHQRQRIVLFVSSPISEDKVPPLCKLKHLICSHNLEPPPVPVELVEIQ